MQHSGVARRAQLQQVMNLDVSVPVLVLGLGDHGSLGIARSLGRLGVAVHGAHNERTPASSSRWFRAVHHWDGTVERALAIGASIGGRPILVPIGDPTAVWVADEADALRERFLFAEPPDGLTRAFMSKRGLHELCTTHAIPTPVTSFPTTRDDVAAYDGLFPVMVKALEYSSVERRRVRRMAIARDTREALALYDELEDPEVPNLLLQELLPGGPGSSWMFDGYFDGASSCVVGYTGQKWRQSPPFGGSASLGECAENDVIANLTQRLVAAVGYSGLVDCDYHLDPRDGCYKLLDFNARVGASFRLFVGTDGLDVVRAMYLDLTGQPVRADRVQVGRRWIAENDDLVSFVLSRRARELTTVDWVRSFRGVQEAAWWSRDDIRPFVRMATATARRAGRGIRALRHRGATP